MQKNRISLLLVHLCLVGLVLIASGCKKAEIEIPANYSIELERVGSLAELEADASGVDEHLLGAERSGKWRAVRNEHLRSEPECIVCGSKSDLYVHHLMPFHLAPELELEDSNLATLCGKHHLPVGHGGNWRSYNPYCLEDAALIRSSLGLPKLRRIPK